MTKEKLWKEVRDYPAFHICDLGAREKLRNKSRELYDLINEEAARENPTIDTSVKIIDGLKGLKRILK